MTTCRFVTSLMLALSVGVIASFLGTVIVWLIRHSGRMGRLLEGIGLLPEMLPSIVMAIGLMLFFTALNIRLGFITLLLAHIIFCIPYVILSIMPKLRQVDDNLAEAALDLGCTPFKALYKVIIPQILPGIISGALIAFTMSFDDFVISYFVTGPGINNISTYVYTSVRRIDPTVNALSTLIVIAITAILIVVNIVPLIKERKFKKHEEIY